MRNMKVPKTFRNIVVGFGSAKAKAPAGFGDDRYYIDCWDNDWLAKRLFGQWKYLKAKTLGLKPAATWFWDADKQQASDWKTTAMHVMNGEYSGNATYEWFEWKEDENGEKQMYRVNQFDRIENTDDPRLINPALDYLFSHPEMTVPQALKEFKRTLVEKKN